MSDLFRERSAVLSPNGVYRYRLDRVVGTGRATMAVIMVNPSTADHESDDPTIRRLVGFAERMRFGRLVVGNLFAFRATDVGRLRDADDPVGPENDRHLEAILNYASVAVAGWGRRDKLPVPLRQRWIAIADMALRLRVPIQCWGTADDGHPRHPLFVPYDEPLRAWERPRR